MNHVSRWPEIRILVWLGIGVAAVALLTLSAPILASFSDLATIFFLSWLLAFLIRPVALRLSRLFGRLPYGVDVGLAYALVGVATGVLLTFVAISLIQSIQQLSVSSSSLGDQLTASLASLQAQLDSAGLSYVQPANWIGGALNAVDLSSTSAVDSFGSIAGSLAGGLGTVLVIVFMSVYIAADRDRILAEMRRVVPTRYHHALDIAQDAVSHSFGGFLRGQIVMGLIYGLVAFVTCVVFGVPFAPLVGVTVALLQAIPYFGQLVSWMPLVVVAWLFQPTALVPVVIVMAVAFVALANILQPRVVGREVGLSPLAVLAAILIGGKVAGVMGAVFSVPVAAAGLAIVQRLADNARALAGDVTQAKEVEPTTVAVGSATPIASADG